MTEATAGRHRHFLLEEVTQTEAYRYPGRRNGGSKIPHRDRVRHGGALRGQIDRLRAEAEDARGAQLDAGMEESLGLRVEFESFPDLELAFESLARERSGIELFNVRHEGNRTLATVFVPEGKLVILENLITAYLDESRDTKTGPRNHRLLNAISSIRAATLEALWTDTAEFPSAEEGLIWWEVWLPLRGERSGRMDSFRERAEVQDIEVGQGELIFPERRVLLARASLEQMQQSMESSPRVGAASRDHAGGANSIAEPSPRTKPSATSKRDGGIPRFPSPGRTGRLARRSAESDPICRGNRRTAIRHIETNVPEDLDLPPIVCSIRVSIAATRCLLPPLIPTISTPLNPVGEPAIRMVMVPREETGERPYVCLRQGWLSPET